MSATAGTMAETAVEFGLKPDEYDVIVRRLNREPNHLELGVFSRRRLATEEARHPRILHVVRQRAGVLLRQR